MTFSPAVMFGGKVIRNDSIAILRERRKHENIESKHSFTSFPCHSHLIPMPLPLPHSHATASTSFPYHCLYLTPNLVPRLSRNANCTRVESLVSFLRKHDIIKIGLKQKGNVLRVVQPTMHSTFGEYDIQPPITRFM